MTDTDLTKFEGHTPGPWKCRKGFSYDEIEVFPYANKKPEFGSWTEVCSVRELPEQKKNAALIAAAPKLLTEVKKLRAEIRSWAGAASLGNGSPMMTPERLESDLAALISQRDAALASTAAWKRDAMALADALQHLEQTNGDLAGNRSPKVYNAMMDAGQSEDDLFRLEDARKAACNILAELKEHAK